MSAVARTLRPLLRCTRTQKRFYADAAGDQMKFTFAGANQVHDQRLLLYVFSDLLTTFLPAGIL